ncbi:MAG: SCO family protein [Candidatus Neomarinimicrobiota bacterium]
MSKSLGALSISSAALLLIILLYRLMSESSVQLPVLGHVPEFSLVNSREEITTREKLKGKVWIADFIFTTCAGPCPIMSTKMAEISDHFLKKIDVGLVSISVNPDYDTPQVLSAYAQKFTGNTEKWQFLTGDYDDIQNIIVNGFKIGDPDEIVFHSTKFALVDRHSRIRGYYGGLENEEIERLKKDILVLLDES